jgi:hypothetical protein
MKGTAMTTSSTIDTIDALVETETRKVAPSRSPATQPTLSIRATVPFSICRAQGSTIPQLCKRLRINEQTFYR